MFSHYQLKKIFEVHFKWKSCWNKNPNAIVLSIDLTRIAHSRHFVLQGCFVNRHWFNQYWHQSVWPWQQRWSKWRRHLPWCFQRNTQMPTNDKGKQWTLHNNTPNNDIVVNASKISYMSLLETVYKQNCSHALCFIFIKHSIIIVQVRYITIEKREAARIGYNGFLFSNSYSGEGRGAI